MQKAVPSIIILVAISMVSPAGINIIAPSMQDFVTVFDTDYGTVQLTLSLFLIAIALSQLVIGPLSDYFGRRPVVLIGMMVSIVGSLMCIFAPTIEVFIVGRILQGMGACTGIALARTVIRDLYDRSKAAAMIGYVTMAMSVAPMVVPLIGGLLQESIGWWGSSAFMLIFTLVVLVGAFFNLHETNPYLGSRTKASDILRNYRALLSDRLFRAFAASCAFASGTYFAFMGAAPLLAPTLLGLSPTGYGLYFILVAVGYGVGNFISGRLSERMGVARMIMMGTSLNLCGVIVLALAFVLGATHPIALFGPAFIMSLSNGMSLPSSIAGAVSVNPKIAGAASGLVGFLQIGIGALIATVTAEWLDISPGIWPLVFVMFASSISALAFAATIGKLDQKAGGENTNIAPIAPPQKP